MTMFARPSNLADRLRFTRQFGQIMTINYPAAAEPHPRMDYALAHAHQPDLFHPDESGGAQPSTAPRCRKPSAFDPDQRARADLDCNWFAYLTRCGRQERKLRLLFIP